jgi:hypothetical protein
MAHSKNGLLIGQASHQEKLEFQRDLIDAELDRNQKEFNRKYMDAVNRLSDIMGSAQFDAWYDSFPSGTIKRIDFLPVMENKIKEIESDVVREE